MKNKPLAGIRVVDLTRVLAGPFCTMILKDLGAEIIKVETPNIGDDARHFGPFLDKENEKSAYFMSINCGKKSLTLNLKDKDGKKALAKLITQSDVLVENYRPGTLAKLGFTDEHIKELNKSMIVASASGFGYSGPDSKKAAYDMIIQSLSGLMSITGTEEGETVRVGSSISDIITGMYTVIGILSALYRRSTENIGARIDVSMLDSTISVLENGIARYQVTNEVPRPLGSRHPSITPFEAFKTKDSEIIIAAGNDKLFGIMCAVIGKPKLSSDERFKTNNARTENFKELREIITNELKENSTSHWLYELTEAQVPCAKVNNIADLFTYPQVKARNMLLPVDGEKEFRVAGTPIKFIGEDDILKRDKPPALGEHNETILEEILDYSEEEIQKLYNNGVLSKK